MPDFVTSEYFVTEVDNWHLKEGAPEEVKKEFDEWMETHRQRDGLIID